MYIGCATLETQECEMNYRESRDLYYDYMAWYRFRELLSKNMQAALHTHSGRISRCNSVLIVYVLVKALRCDLMQVTAYNKPFCTCTA